MKRSYSFQPQLKVDCYHVAEAKRLYVKKVTLNDLLKRWVPINPGKTLDLTDTYYAVCSVRGDIDWNTAKIYTSLELVGRNNVVVVTYTNKEATQTSA